MLDVHSVILTEEGAKKAREAGFMSDIPLAAAPLEGPLPVWKGREGRPETDELAVIFSTSGTSGLPKAVGCTHGNLIGDLEPIAAHVPGLESETGVILNVLPNFHAFGYTVAGLLALTYGMAQTVVPSFVPVENTIKAIKESGVNRVIAEDCPDIPIFFYTHTMVGSERVNALNMNMLKLVDMAEVELEA